MIVDDVVEGYLDAASERELDPAILALLHIEGYRDVRLIHGAFEFGKDFIAKSPAQSPPVQYAIQSKAGDIGLSSWREAKPQLIECYTNDLAHPDFDEAMARQGVFLTSGRLHGGAPLDAQQLNKWLQEQGHRPIEFWERDSLKPRLSAVLVDGPPHSRESNLLSLLGAAAAGDTSDKDLELFSRAWFGAASPLESWSNQFEALCICNQLKAAGRVDLACHLALCLIRVTVAKESSKQSPLHKAALAIFKLYTDELVAQLEDDYLDVKATVAEIGDFASVVTYPVRCLRLIELIGLRGWLALSEGDLDTATSTAGIVLRLMEVHPGTSHPISDRWAISLVPSALLVGRVLDARDSLKPYFERVAVWVCDHYEQGVGLANPYSDTSNEIAYLAGAYLEHIDVPKRRQSYLATVLLDLAWTLGLPDTYENILNDLRAVTAYPTIVIAASDESILGVASHDARAIANVPYSSDVSADQSPATHHRIPLDGLRLVESNLFFELLAAWSVTRDRHLPAAMSACLSSYH